MTLIHPRESMIALENGLDYDDIDSIMWGIWEMDKKRLRPHVYSLMKLGGKVVRHIIKKFSQKSKSTKEALER